MNVLRIPCTGRLAHIATSLRALSPLTLLQLYRCDDPSFVEVAAATMPNLPRPGEGHFTFLAETVIEVADV